MKRIGVTLGTLLIICIAGFFILKLTNPNLFEREITTTYKVVEVYEQMDKGIDFESYRLNSEKDMFSIRIKNVNIIYENKNLSINGINVANNTSIKRVLAFYKNKLVMAGNESETFDTLYIYDINKKEIEKIKRIDGYYLDLNEIFFSKTTIDFNLSIVHGKDVYLKDKKINICDNKTLGKKDVKRGISYMLNGEYEVIYITDAISYISINCKS